MSSGDWTCLIFIILLFTHVESQLEEDIFVSNLTPGCMKCLCAASSGCPLQPLGCDSGYCGPFQISKAYWMDAVKGTPLATTDDKVFQDCVNVYKCASQVVTYYIARYARDCNKDGVVTCEDFLMINHNGGYECEKPLDRNPVGIGYLRRYMNCTENPIS
ncbi:hypothetical protein Trydic_g9078 [Trypoxylus dichotomus]